MTNSPLQLRKSFPVLTFTFWKKSREYCYPDTQLNLTTWVNKPVLLPLVCPLPPLSTTVLRNNVTKHHHSQNLLPGMARLGKEGARPCFTSGDGREWNAWAKISYGKRAGFSPQLGEDFQFDEDIFQMGWFNHQLAKDGWFQMCWNWCAVLVILFHHHQHHHLPPFICHHTTIPVTAYLIQKAH